MWLYILKRDPLLGAPCAKPILFSYIRDEAFLTVTLNFPPFVKDINASAKFPHGNICFSILFEMQFKALSYAFWRSKKIN